MRTTGTMPEAAAESTRLYNELPPRNPAEKAVNGLNSIMCPLLRMWALTRGIDTGGVLMDVPLQIPVRRRPIMLGPLEIRNRLFIGKLVQLPVLGTFDLRNSPSVVLFVLTKINPVWTPRVALPPRLVMAMA